MLEVTDMIAGGIEQQWISVVISMSVMLSSKQKEGEGCFIKHPTRTMKKKKIVCFLILVSLFLCACANQNEMNFETQFDEETNQNIIFQGVNISIPVEWTENEEVGTEKSRVFEELDETQDSYSPLNLLMMEQYEELDDLDEGMTVLETVYADAENCKIIERKDLTIDGHAAKALTAKENREKEELYFQQVMFEKDGNLILLSFSCKRESSLTDFDKVIKSITIEE